MIKSNSKTFKSTWHVHELEFSNSTSLWYCDGQKFLGGCKSGFTNGSDTAGQKRYRCSPCDFDLCEKCLIATCPAIGTYSPLSNYVFEGVSEEMLIEDKFKKLVLCSICMFVLNEPVTLPCAHSFCKKCVTRCSKCPLCKALLSRPSTIPRNITLSEIIDALDVNCPSHFETNTSACETKGLQVKTIESHAKSCGNVTLKCICNKLIPRKDFFISKIECDCPFIICKYCTQLQPKRLIKYHQEMCKETKIKCKKCGNTYTRKNKPNHETKECPANFFSMTNKDTNETSRSSIKHNTIQFSQNASLTWRESNERSPDRKKAKNLLNQTFNGSFSCNPSNPKNPSSTRKLNNNGANQSCKSLLSKIPSQRGYNTSNASNNSANNRSVMQISRRPSTVHSRQALNGQHSLQSMSRALNTSYNHIRSEPSQ